MAQSRRKKARRSRGSASYWIASISIAVLALFLFVRPYTIATSGPEAKDNKIRVKISMAGWAPKVIKAKAGEPLTITLINMDNQFHADGGGWHDFVLEELGVDERVWPKGVKSFTFTPDKPGEYMFYCSLCCGGKEDPSMQGKLIVM